MGFIPSPEKRIARWLESHGVEKGSPRYKRELFFQSKKSSDGQNSSLIDTCLSNSGLFQRRAVTPGQKSDLAEGKEPFKMTPIEVPHLN